MVSLAWTPSFAHGKINQQGTPRSLQTEGYRPSRKCKSKRTSVSPAFSTALSLALVFSAVTVSVGYYELALKPQIKLMQRRIQENGLEIARLRSSLKDTWTSNPSKSSNITLQLRTHGERYKRAAGFIGAHLAGVSGQNIRQRGAQSPQNGRFFVWSRNANSHAFSMMEVENVNGDATFILINKNAYYVVYSQVTYYSKGLYEVGHETVVISRYGRETVLMLSVNTQQLASAKSGSQSRAMDTGFQSGVFYLIAGQKLGVRPADYGLDHVFMTDGNRAFFGAYILHD